MKPENLIKIKRARSALMLNQPFFGYLSCMLEPQERKIKTFATDGKHLIIDPDFADKLSEEEFGFIFAHEVMHVALDHLSRREAKDPEVWNMAIDYATNDLLVSEGFQMPRSSKGLYNPDFAKKSAEEIYNILMKQGAKGATEFDVHIFGNMSEKELKEIGDKLGKDFGQGVGGLDPQAIKELKDAMIMAANIAKSQGKCPASIEALIQTLVKPKVSWKRHLSRFLVANISMNDYSYNRLNRRYMAQGMAMPLMRSPAPPPVGVALDTSGSISDEELQQFVSEVQSFARLGWDFDVYLFVNDASLHHYKKVKARQLNYKKDIKITGRGGTDFRPVFDKIKDEHLHLACLVFLTDTYGDFPSQKPAYPVMWVKPSANDGKVPFGQIINIVE